MESLESLVGRRSALRPLRGDGPRRGAIRGERERLREDLKRSCLGESDRDLRINVNIEEQSGRGSPRPEPASRFS